MCGKFGNLEKEVKKERRVVREMVEPGGGGRGGEKV